MNRYVGLLSGEKRADMAPVSIAEHISLIDQLKDSFEGDPDLDHLHEVHLLTEEINSHCDTSEDRIKSIIRGMR